MKIKSRSSSRLHRKLDYLPASLFLHLTVILYLAGNDCDPIPFVARKKAESLSISLCTDEL